MSESACLLLKRPTLTRADRERMMQEAEPCIRAYVLKSTVPPSRHDDLMGDCRLAVWKVIDRFDPARKVAWPTYVISVVKRTILRHLSALKERGGLGGVDMPHQFAEAFYEPTNFEASTIDLVEDHRKPVGEDEDDEPDDQDAQFRALRNAIRRDQAEPLLAKLQPKSRRLVELLIFDGLTVGQVADQLGQPLKCVRTNLQAAIGRMTGAKPKHMTANVRAEYKAKIRTLLAAHPRWTVPRIRQELGDGISRSAVDRLVKQIRQADREQELNNLRTP